MTRHANEGETIAAAIKDCLDYGKNPEKTEGKYISVYECDPATVADEFLLAKASYKAMTGREQTKENDVLCYQIRMAFYPGEITPKEANRIGYELAMRWTKGRHAFLVTTHTDKKHIQERFTRLRASTLGDGYDLKDILTAIEGKADRRRPERKISLAVDIQAKLAEGKGPGYERWAKVFNLKQMAPPLPICRTMD